MKFALCRSTPLVTQDWVTGMLAGVRKAFIDGQDEVAFPEFLRC